MTPLENLSFAFFFLPFNVIIIWAQKALKKLDKKYESPLAQAYRLCHKKMAQSFWQPDISQFTGFCIFNQEAEWRKQ